MTCPICAKPCTNLVSAIRHNILMSERCHKCASTFVPPSPYAAKYKRDRMRENHRGDLVQAYNGDKPNPDFARLYPERARKQFGDKYMETI